MSNNYNMGAFRDYSIIAWGAEFRGQYYVMYYERGTERCIFTRTLRALRDYVGQFGLCLPAGARCDIR